MLGLIVFFLAGCLKVSRELMEGVRVSPAVTSLHVSVESWIIEHLLNTHQWVFLGVIMNVYSGYVTSYVNVCVRQAFVWIHMCVSACFFRARYQSAADLSLLSASTQMFGHCPFSESWSGICKDKQREQFTQNDKSVMSDGGKVILVCCAFKVWDTSCSPPGTCDTRMVI